MQLGKGRGLPGGNLGRALGQIGGLARTGDQPGLSPGLPRTAVSLSPSALRTVGRDPGKLPYFPMGQPPAWDPGAVQEMATSLLPVLALLAQEQARKALRSHGRGAKSQEAEGVSQASYADPARPVSRLGPSCLSLDIRALPLCTSLWMCVGQGLVPLSSGELLVPREGQVGKACGGGTPGWAGQAWLTPKSRGDG